MRFDPRDVAVLLYSVEMHMSDTTWKTIDFGALIDAVDPGARSQQGGYTFSNGRTLYHARTAEKAAPAIPSPKVPGATPVLPSAGRWLDSLRWSDAARWRDTPET